MSDQTVPPFPVDAAPETPPPTPPPDGTTKTTFWQSGGAKAAITVTVGLCLMVLRGIITGDFPSREAIAVAVEGVAYAGLAARGLSRLDTDALRWR